MCKIVSHFRLNAIIVCLILYCSVVSAQSKHEFSNNVGHGFSMLKIPTATGKQKIGFGWHGGVGYNLFFSNKWSLGTGIELMQCNSLFKYDNFSTRYMTVDMEGNAFEFRSYVTEYRETQRLLQLQIPLMLQYQTGEKYRFYSAAGLKAGIPVRGKYTNTGEDISNSGYYSEENYEYTTQKFMGFGDFDAITATGKLDLKTAYFLSVEAGVKINMGALKWKMGGRWAIYTGVYFDYGLNNVLKPVKVKSQPHFIEYKPDLGDYSINSVIFSQNENEVITEKIFPISAGVKLRLVYGTDRSLTKGEYPLFKGLRFYK